MDKKIINKIRESILSDTGYNKGFLTSGSFQGLQLPQEYIDRMTALGEKYKDIKWLPLDIPKIEIPDIEEFKALWEEESVDTLRIKVDAAEPWSKEDHPKGLDSSWYVPSFKGLHLYQHEMCPLEDHSWTGKVYKGNNKQLKRILEQAFEYFPIHTFTSIFMWQSVDEIYPHQDQGAFWKCPTEFRCMLHDENPEPTLYVVDIERGDTTYIDLPKDTNSFCWSNGTQLHGSDYKGKKKFLLAVAGVQHSVKCEELFERSIEKYKDQLNYKLDL